MKLWKVNLPKYLEGCFYTFTMEAWNNALLSNITGKCLSLLIWPFSVHSSIHDVGFTYREFCGNGG